MSFLKQFTFALVVAAFSGGVAYAQAPLVLADAELAVPFGAVKGQMAMAGSQILFIATDSQKASLAIERADMTNMQRTGDVVTITTRGMLRDADGERNTFRFRLSQPADLMSWYAKNTPGEAATSVPATALSALAPGVLASYQVRHDHALGSCLGTLILTEEGVSFESNEKIEDSRQWKLIDIKQVAQNGAYKLAVEPFRGGTFNFDLFAKGMDSGEYRRLVDRIARARVVR